MSAPGQSVERFEHGGGTLVDEVLAGPSDRHLIFLHGWGGSRDSLRGIAVLFQSTHRVHLIDLPGFGDAPLPPQDWGTPNYTDLLQQYITDRIAGPMLLVGHSFGGRVSVRLAARHPPDLRGLVLMGAPGLPATGMSSRQVRRWGIRTLRSVLRGVEPVIGDRGVQWHTRRFGSTDYLAAGALRPILVRTVNEDLTDCARAVACPVLLLWGTDDTEAPVWMGERYKELMNGHATLRLLPHKDHHFYTGTGAHLCAFKIREWLDAMGAR